MRLRMTLIATLAAAVVVAGASASGARQWHDPSGDAGTAPDITDVVVANDDTGRVSIRATIPNRTALDADDEIVVVFDVDHSPVTAAYDYAIGYLGGETFGSRWNADRERWVDERPPASYAFAWDKGVASFSIDRRDLGMSNELTFYVVSWDTEANDPSDVAPDGEDTYDYTLHLPFALRVAPPPPAFALPSSAKAGKAFSLAARIVREDTGQTLHAGRIACNAKVAGKPLATSARPRFFSVSVVGGADYTQAVCDWKLPATAKGKTLQAAVTVSLNGKSATRTLVAKVR